MKKILKSRIFLVIITIILTLGTTVCGAILYNANQVAYTPSDTTWNVASVDEALNDLYNTANTKLNSTTATQEEILSGKTAYSRGSLVTGTMPNNGAVNATISSGGSYTIPAGYHNGEGKVTAGAQNSIELIGTLEWTGSDRSNVNFTSKTITYNGNDKENLTINSFILELVSSSYCASPWGHQAAGFWNCPFTPSKAYDTSTGILTVNPNSQAISGDTLVVNPTGLKLNVYVKH